MSLIAWILVYLGIGLAVAIPCFVVWAGKSRPVKERAINVGLAFLIYVVAWPGVVLIVVVGVAATLIGVAFGGRK